MPKASLQQSKTPILKHLTTHRRCPACGGGVGLVRLWLWAWIFAQWDCRSCGAHLGFNKRRRTVVALVAAPFTALALVLASQREWLLSLAAFALSLLLWRLDSLQIMAPREDGVPDARR